MNYRNEDSDADEDDTEPSRYHPVSCTGLQPDSKVFVFGPEFQIEEDGAVISQEKQQYTVKKKCGEHTKTVAYSTLFQKSVLYATVLVCLPHFFSIIFYSVHLD